MVDDPTTAWKRTSGLSIWLLKKPALPERRGHDLGILGRGQVGVFQANLGMVGGLIRIVYPRHTLKFTGPGPRVEAFGVPALAGSEVGVDKDLNEGFTHQGPAAVAGLAKRADRRADNGSVVANDLGSYKPDSPDVSVAVFAGKTQALRKVLPDFISVEESHDAAFLHQERAQGLGGGRFAGSGQAGKPYAKTARDSWRQRLPQNGGGFGPG